MSSIASYMQANTTHIPDPRFENVPEVEDEYGINARTDDTQNNTSKKFRLKISKRLHYTAIFAFVSYLVLLTSFASPYWLSSYKFTDSAFKRLGLWDFCFQDYRHPSYQYDTKFNGCHWIYSSVYTNIRDWLQPPWFMFVQAVTTIALCTATLGLLTVSIIFMHFLIQYQLIIMCTTMLCHMVTTLLLTFAILTFYLKAFDRSWIMYPDFNHVDWAFFFALVSAAGNGFVSYMYYHEVRILKERMLKMKRLIVATTTGNGRSIAGGDMDSLDAVYASRSVTSYNQSMAGHHNENPMGGARGGGDNRPHSANNNNKDLGLMYPHFTQV